MGPKPCSGPESWRPSTLRLTAPSGTCETFTLGTGWAHPLDVWGGCCVPSAMICSLLGLCRLDGVRFRLVRADCLVEASELEDGLVVVAETAGQETLLGAVDADQQRDQEADATTVHVLEVVEVEDDDAGPIVGREGVRIGESLIGKGRQFPFDVEHGDVVGHFADVGGKLRLGHHPSPY